MLLADCLAYFANADAEPSPGRQVASMTVATTAYKAASHRDWHAPAETVEPRS